MGTSGGIKVVGWVRGGWIYFILSYFHVHRKVSRLALHHLQFHENEPALSQHCQHGQSYPRHPLQHSRTVLVNGRCQVHPAVSLSGIGLKRLPSCGRNNETTHLNCEDLDEYPLDNSDNWKGRWFRRETSRRKKQEVKMNKAWKSCAELYKNHWGNNI